MSDQHSSQRMVRRFYKNAKRVLGLVVLVLEIVKRLLDFFR
jgi:hypothetical protein